MHLLLGSGPISRMELRKRRKDPTCHITRRHGGKLGPLGRCGEHLGSMEASLGKPRGA